MSVQPPSGQPEGPPSGPLSGPDSATPPPPPGPPSGPTSSGGGTTPPGRGPAGPSDGDRGGGPWWRSVPKVALLTAVIVAAVAVSLVLTRPGGGSQAGGEIFLQSASKTGPSPFTDSAVRGPAESQPPAALPPSTNTAPTAANVTRGVDGSTPGLYGGTEQRGSCDTAKMISSLRAEPAKNRAFASVLRIAPTSVPSYLGSLTSVSLRMDTRVTYNGYENGAAEPHQAVLQAGTAVLVDDRGVPRVRCACSNPLQPPVAVRGTPERTGDTWSGYSASNTVIVQPAPKPVTVFVVYDRADDSYFARDRGDDGTKDRPAPRPHHPSTPTLVPPSPTGTTGKESKPARESSGSGTSTSPSGEPSSRPPSSESPSEKQNGKTTGPGTTSPPAPETSSQEGTTVGPPPEQPPPQEPTSEPPPPEEQPPAPQSLPQSIAPPSQEPPPSAQVPQS
ncbi:DUF6777 domain-containing protein [Streptomyces sp. NPDC059175]|uniref:DUF6777 domain-containing protein n=1 Tax=unclassified Streptomyces TaxID=2593676 RepID=UPI003698F82A